MPRTTTIKNPTLDVTLGVMKNKANEAKKTLRPLAEKICAGLESGDYNSEIYALYAFACQNQRYARDIFNVEYVKAPARMLESKVGDCDDFATLLAALCMAMGNECRFLVVGFEDAQPSHVYCQVAVRGGGVKSVDGNVTGEKLWVTVDPVAADSTNEMHKRIRFVRVFPIA